MSKKQYDSSENEKQDQLEMSSEKKKTTPSPRTTTATVKGARLTENTENNLEMSPQHRQTERNETTAETHTQKEIKSGRKHKTKSKFIHLLIIRLSLWFTAAVLKSSKHLPNKHFQPPPLIRRHSHYKCIIKKILKKLHKIKEISAHIIKKILKKLHKIKEISAHFNYLQLLKKISTWTVNAYRWLRCRWPVVKCITESIATISIVSSYFLNAFKHNNLALSVIVHLRRILGICPIRLISLKRLPQQQQQIPKNHLKLYRGQEEEQGGGELELTQNRQQLVKAFNRERELATLRINDKIAVISFEINPAFVVPLYTKDKLVLTRSKQLATLQNAYSPEMLSLEQTQLFTNHQQGSAELKNVNRKLATPKRPLPKQLTTLQKQCSEEFPSQDQTQIGGKLKSLFKYNLGSAEIGNVTNELATLKRSHSKALLSQDIKRSITLSNYKQNSSEKVNVYQQLAMLNKRYAEVRLSQEQIQVSGGLKLLLLTCNEQSFADNRNGYQQLATLNKLYSKFRLSEEQIHVYRGLKTLLLNYNGHILAKRVNVNRQLATPIKYSEFQLSPEYTNFNVWLKTLPLNNTEQSLAERINVYQQLATPKMFQCSIHPSKEQSHVVEKRTLLIVYKNEPNLLEIIKFNNGLATPNNPVSDMFQLATLQKTPSEEQTRVYSKLKSILMSNYMQNSCDRQLATLYKRYSEVLLIFLEIIKIKRKIHASEEQRTFLGKKEQNLLQIICIKKGLATPNKPCSDMFLLYKEQLRQTEDVETTQVDSTLLLSIRKYEPVNQELSTPNTDATNSYFSAQGLVTVTTVTPSNALLPLQTQQNKLGEEKTAVNPKEFCHVKDELRILLLLTKEINRFKLSTLKRLSMQDNEFPNKDNKCQKKVEKLVVTTLAGSAKQNEEDTANYYPDLATLKGTCLKLLTTQERANAPKLPTNMGSEKEVKTKPKEHKEVTTLERVRQEGAKEVIQLPTRHYRRNNKHYLVYEQPQNEHQKYFVEQTRHYRQQHRHQPKRTESHHQEHKYQHILFVARCSWQICGFPLVSKEIFKYLLDLTERTFRATDNSSSNEKRNSATLPLCIAHDNGSDNVGRVKHGQDAVRQLGYPTDVLQQRNPDEVYRNAKMSWAKKNLKRTSDAASLPFTQSEEAASHLLTPTPPTSSSSSSSYSSSFFAIFRPSRTPTSPPSSLYCDHYHHSNFHIKLPCSALPLTSSSNGGNTTTLLLLLLLLLSSMWHTSEAFHGSVKLSTNTIKTKYGLVRGIVVRSSPLVEAYLGIPYASPPVGSLRFMPPITPSTWKNVRNADRFSAVCPQTVPIPPNGPEALLEVPRARLAQLRRLLPLLSNQSEDCLYLNIYVPYENRRHRRFTTNSGEMHDQPLLPTILFLHGESYEWNSGNPYDGSELATHGNVIVVTINFRLGIFGFLKTGGKESAQGNFGLMDLVAGLHWLKENLPAFGGDPQAITLLGHGTGASLANILAVSPVASDLIHHVALVSGSALSPWAIQKNPLFVKRRVAEQTGCHGDMLYDDLAPCLRTKSVAELLAVKIDHPRFLVGFAPFIDGTVISPNTDYIGKLSLPMGSAIVSTSGIEYANFPKRNLIFCLTSVESHLDLSAQDLEFGFNETRRDRILRTYVRNNFHYHLNEIFAVLKNEYTDWEKAIRSPLSSRDATLQFLSDGHTASSLIKLGYMHSLRGGKGYFLHFKHRTVEEEYPQRTGSVRGEDVPFWLGLPISPLFPHNYTTQERQISRLMLRYLANFAKTGNPNQSSLSSPLPSSSTLIGSPSSVASSQTNEDHQKYKRSSLPKTPANIVNASSLSLSPSSSASSSGSSNRQQNNSTAHTLEDVASAAAREALNLAVLYNQRRTKRTYFKRHSRSNTEDSHNGSGSGSSEVGYFLGSSGKLDGDEMPFWDAYDVVNQLYMELGNKAEIQSHYRGHKLSMWLNLIPQLHRHANMNDQSMRHHQFQDDLNNMNLYEGIVRAQIQIKPADDEETLLLPKGRPTTAPPPTATLETNTTQKPSGGTTECGVDGAMFVAEMTTAPPTDNRSFIENREKEMATASTGLIGNLEVLRRLSGKQFQSYTTALVATVAVGCFLLILNILIFAGIYHQREKRARDAKTKEELQDNDTSKNSSILKLNALGSETGSFNGSGAGVSGKTTVVFGEYSCYDEKSVQTKDEKLMVDLPPSQMMDSNWVAACSTSTLDLLKTKHHLPLEPSYTMTSNIVPITTEQPNEHLMAVSAMEMATYNPLPAMVSGSTGLILDPSHATSSGLQSKRGSFVGSAGQLNQYDFASVQSSDQMSFKDIENAVKVSMTRDDDITQDDDIPEPPPPPKSFQNMQQFQQQQQQQQAMASSGTSGTAGGGGGGILRQAGTSSATQTGGGKKRVHIQEISV